MFDRQKDLQAAADEALDLALVMDSGRRYTLDEIRQLRENE